MDLTTQIHHVIFLANRKGYPDAADWIQRNFFNQIVSDKPRPDVGNRASTMNDRIEPIALYAINQIAKRKNIDLVSECVTLMDCMPGELSKEAGVRMRNHLEAIETSETMQCNQ